MDIKYYWEMCREHLFNKMLDINHGSNDPTEKIKLRMNSFANKYKSKLTGKEYQCLIDNDKKWQISICYLKSRKAKKAI